MGLTVSHKTTKNLAVRRETGCAEFGYFHCYVKMDAPTTLVFRPLVKGNEALGTRLGVVLGVKPDVQNSVVM